ncbi:hypothetical protein [Roseivirga sp. 4D4]|uniref:hypothetical protein n=1 Tax=Roseivirga sp. 4D4 TaxID=1889784 RepID=UPI001112D46F|nr:hypothetical protein [Roseivirga sp. 4D4]
MKFKLVVVITIMTLYNGLAQDQENNLVHLLNHTVGGKWISTNEKNSGKPEDFRSFMMEFAQMADEQSVWGDIIGIKNNGDTLHLMEVWNFINPAKKEILLVQRTSWGETSIGNIVPYEGKHLDIQFKSTTAQGQEYFVRDIHYVIGEDEMKAETFQKMALNDKWVATGTSTWKRIK